jgi:heptosyltransferase-2
MANKILIVGPAWVGDMVMAQSLFRLLRQTRPDCIIDVLAPNATLPLLSCMPEVRRAIPLPFTHGQLALKQRYELACSLRAEKYDQAILLPNTFKSALIPFWAHIPIRTGWHGEMRWGLLNDRRRLDKQKYPLMIQRFCALAFPPNAPLPDRLPWPALSKEPLQETKSFSFTEITGAGKPKLVLCPGAEFGPAKRWPPAYYADVAKARLALGWDVWLMGSRGDRAAADEIQELTKNGCIDLVGKTSLLEAVSLLAMADAVVSNDSGLMHIAAALQRPLVVIYGSTDPRFTPPLAENVSILSLKLPCSPCFQRECPLHHLKCLRDLAPDHVLAALDTIVNA